MKRLFLLALAKVAKIFNKPWHVFAGALLIVLIFALVYMFTGIGSRVHHHMVPERNFFECLYFSVVTFTTVGYGDLTPISGLSKILVSLEAFLGPASLTLFMATLIKKSIQE
jgi:voltage-gated potassium channel Kch